jgi:hypothetical protein
MKIGRFLQILASISLVATLGCQTRERTTQAPVRVKTPEQIEFDQNLTRAQQGDAEAQYRVGFYYAERKRSLYENSREAIKWLKLSLSQGYGKAQPLLAEVEQSEAKRKSSFEDFKDKAETGDAKAQYNLGRCYANSLGVARDMAEAVKWYRKAAEQNNAQAQVALGGYYEFNVQDDPWHIKEAMQWYRRAAQQNDPTGQLLLGSWCEILHNYVEAYMWEYLAFMHGGDSASSAIQHMSSMARFMSPSQIDEAKQLAREFKPQKASD